MNRPKSILAVDFVRVRPRWQLSHLIAVTVLIASLLAGIVERNRSRARLMELAAHVESHEIGGAQSFLGLAPNPSSQPTGSLRVLTSIFGEHTNRNIDRLVLRIGTRKEYEAMIQLLAERSALRSCENLELSIAKEWKVPIAEISQVGSVRSLVLFQSGSDYRLGSKEFQLLSKMPNLEVLVLSGVNFEPADTECLNQSLFLAALRCNGDEHVCKRLRDLLPHIYIVSF